MSTVAELLKAHKDLQSFMTGKMAQFEAQFSDSTSVSTRGEATNLPPDYCEFKSFAMQMFNLFAKQIEQVQNSVDSLETRQRANFLLLRGLPEVVDENVLERTLDVFQNKLCVKDFQASSFQRCHRLGSKAEGVTRSVLVCFGSQQSRQDIWKLKSKLKGSPLSISEFLTKSRQAVYQEARKYFGVSNCWTQDGVIHIKVPDGSRKRVILHRDLQALMKAFPLDRGEVVEAAANNSSKNRPKRNINKKQ